MNINRSTLDLSEQDHCELSDQDETDSEDQHEEYNFRPSDLNLEDATSEEMVRAKGNEILTLIEELGKP